MNSRKELEYQMAIRLGLQNAKDYKRLKRRQYNELLTIIKSFREGMAGLPNYHKLKLALDEVGECGDELRKWWAKS